MIRPNVGRYGPTSHVPPYRVDYRGVQLTIEKVPDPVGCVRVEVAQEGCVPHFAGVMASDDAIGLVADVVRRALLDHLSDEQLLKLNPYDVGGKCAVLAAELVGRANHPAAERRPVVWSGTN